MENSDLVSPATAFGADTPDAVTPQSNIPPVPVRVSLDLNALDDKEEALTKSSIAPDVVEVDTTTPELKLPEGYISPIDSILGLSIADTNEIISISHHDHVALAQLIERLDDQSDDNLMFKEIVQKFGAEKAFYWLRNTNDSLSNLSYKNGLVPAANNTEADWKQGIFYKGFLYEMHRPGIDETLAPDGRLRGKQAMTRLRSIMKMGDYLTVDLPHSGFWITIEIPGDDVLVNFRMRLLAEKVELGRRTNGLVFSNSNVYVAKHMSDMLLNCVVSSSIQITDKAELLKLIKEPDLDIIAHSYMSARHRNGYKLAESCTASPSTCSHIQVSQVTVGRMKIIDNNKLTESQKGHMANVTSQTVKDVIAYQESFAVFRDNVQKIDDEIEITFQVPSLDTKIKYGQNWVNNIVDNLDIVFNKELNADHRNQAITEQAGINNLVTYAHWIKCIRFKDGGFVDDEKMITKALIEMNRNEEYSAKIYDAINAFINKAVVGIIAIPRFVCPECKQRQPKVLNAFPAFTPVNMCKIFFTMMTNTLSNYYARSDI